ncbi:MAG: RDD family protein [Bacteroidota bacterium]
MTEDHYPGVFDRFKAIAADGALVIVLMFAAAYVFSLFETVPDNARILAFVLIFILYDPLFTGILGGTVGHMMIGIRVKRASDETKNILFPLAIIRYIVKAGLGWISLLTISGNAKRRAIHDYLVGSVVVYAKPFEHTEEPE